jgi:SAM-dependent methyltransferase
MTNIDDIRRFWDENPLWTGESSHKPGTLAFFEEHRTIYYGDCFAGTMDERIFPEHRGKVLDLGCGIGFWPVEFWERGFRDITAADLSPASLALAGRRAEAYGADVAFREENAENLSFAAETFDHVNCLGVVHHTVSPERAVSEIHRVLKHGGTATISVYYKNMVLRHFRLFRPLAKLIGKVGARLSGRGREAIYSIPDVAEIVRLYDGAKNPKGIAYDRGEFRDLVGAFRVDEVFYHFFPARSLPVRIPRWLHRMLNRRLPFMIVARLTKL